MLLEGGSGAPEFPIMHPSMDSRIDRFGVQYPQLGSVLTS